MDSGWILGGYTTQTHPPVTMRNNSLNPPCIQAVSKQCPNGKMYLINYFKQLCAPVSKWVFDLDTEITY